VQDYKSWGKNTFSKMHEVFSVKKYYNLREETEKQINFILKGGLKMVSGDCFFAA
jgi:hypothetical protein